MGFPHGSDGIESTCNARDRQLTLSLFKETITVKKKKQPRIVLDLPGGAVDKNRPASARNMELFHMSVRYNF